MVLVILGIVAATAAPRMLSISALEASRAQQRALSDLRFAQHRSVASGCPVRVDFTAAGYTLDQRSGCRTGAFGTPIADPETNTAPFTATLPAGVSISSDVDPLVFDELGRATNASGLVTNANIDVGGRSLEAIGETGLVRVP